MGTIIYAVGFVALMWFFLFRPQQQQAKKRAQMLSNLKTGMKVTTIGGICGVIKAITDTKVYIEIADGITIEMLRSAIGQIDDSDNFADEKYGEDEEDEDIYYDDDEDDDEYEDDDEDDSTEQKVSLNKR